jgi:hypothetical protein
MGFKEDLQKLSVQVSERKLHITNEEMTKQALIIPFVQILGFDVFNPVEVRPEYIADFGKKKGEKVDYAIFKDNSPIMFVEAKSVNENLANHDAQLSRYFNAVSEVKLGILTNGIQYKFFTDLTADNMMDDEPFLVIDILNLKDSDIENLAKLRKEDFDREFLVRYAEELVYTSALDDSLKELFKNPSDEFIRFLIKDFSNSRITNNVIERFRPIVKKAISNAVLDIVSKGLYQQEVVAAKAYDDVVVSESENIKDDNIKKRTVVTTEEELQSFEYIKSVLTKSGKDIKNLGSKDTTNYYSINNGNTLKWFLRLNYDNSIKNIITKLEISELEKVVTGFKVEVAPKGCGESRVIINSWEDLKKLDQMIIYCFDNA